MGDNISTDGILKAGAEVLPFRSNIPEISKFAYIVLDETFYDRAKEAQEKHGGHIVIAGHNYAQGSSREHAAIAPRYLGQKAVIAKSYARIGWQNLANFGIAPLEFTNDQDYNNIEQGDTLKIDNLDQQLENGKEVTVTNETKGTTFQVTHSLSGRQLQSLLDGGLINSFIKNK
jgi:aconitate hydratase